MKDWFNGWSWLKCSGGQFNFGRFVAYQLFLFNSAALTYWYGYKADNLSTITNWQQVALQCSAYIAGLIVYFIEIFCREKVKLQLSVLGKDININKKGK